MPWKETDVMNLRSEFVLRALSGELPFRRLCAEYAISAKTGYKWKERFLREGMQGLRDRSRRPHSSPNQLSENVTCSLVRLKTRHPKWGPKKVREVFSRQDPGAQIPSLSTVKRVLEKAGLVQHRRRSRQQDCGRIQNRRQPQRPNDIWTVDFKGWWYSADRRRIEPLTVRDAYSRYLLCARALENAKWQTVRERFERIFATYGLPCLIRSDNGPPFASARAPLGLSRLSAWWVALGIDLDRIEPAHPQQNAGHERMHRDIAMEVEAGADGDFAAQQAVLDAWSHEFNHQRPHEALGMRMPAELYVRSSRPFDPSPPELCYPADYLRRKASQHGAIGIQGRQIQISLAVAGWDLGLKATGSGHYAVWFGPLCLGQIDMRSQSFQAAPEVRKGGAPPHTPGLGACRPKAGGDTEGGNAP
jgi:transposase InsO family protein